MKTYTVQEAFERLQQYKITSNIESVRRWLRTGALKGLPPATRKEGWRIREEELVAFIQDRLPAADELAELEHLVGPNKEKTTNTTNVAKETCREEERARMWWEIVHRNIFEGFIPLKRSTIRACIQHRRQSKSLEEQVWQECLNNKRGYSSPRVPYLLDAFLFDGQRIKMDENFADLEEKIVFALIDYVRRKNVSG